jgi:hypothetical protein
VAVAVVVVAVVVVAVVSMLLAAAGCGGAAAAHTGWPTIDNIGLDMDPEQWNKFEPQYRHPHMQFSEVIETFRLHDRDGRMNRCCRFAVVHVYLYCLYK